MSRGSPSRRPRVLVPAIALLGGLVATGVLARTLTVDDDGPADFRSVGQAMAVAVAGDLITVAPGLYLETVTVRCGVVLEGAGADRTTPNGGESGPTVTISNCDGGTRVSGFQIRGGVASRGGGVLVRGGAPVITRNTMTANRAFDSTGLSYGYGGGVALLDASAVLTDNWFAANEADVGGGIDVEGGSPMIRRNLITQNLASVGGGLDAYLFSDGAWISANTVQRNIAVYGAGFELSGIGAPVVTSNLIVGNTASATGPLTSYGGGIDVYYSDARIFNNTVADNRADRGGGLAVEADSFGTPSAVNNLLFGNVGTRGGGGAELDAPGVSVLSNIFYQNSTDCEGASAWVCSESSNLFADPMFVDESVLDFRLRAGSPAIDSGRTEGAPVDDLRGQRRPLDGNADAVAAIDRGACEYDRNEVLGVEFDSPGSFVWQPVIGAGAYHVYSAPLSSLRVTGFGECRDPDDADITDQLFTESRPPAIGDGLAYVVTAVVSGNEGSAGFDSGGLERPPPASCP